MMWGDPQTGAALLGAPAVVLDGLPVLVPDAPRFMARHGPSWTVGGPHVLVPPEPLPIDAPDPLTPHLGPGEWPEELLPTGPFGDWLRGLGTTCPDAVCAAWGEELAPAGVAVDGGCGVGGMARRMAATRAQVLAFDRSPRAVLLARALVAGRLPQLQVPGGRGELIPVAWPHPAVPEGRIQWAVGDVALPPLQDGSVAWLHLGAVVDMVECALEEVLEAALTALMPSGLLTLATPHDEDAVPMPGAARPSDRLREALQELGLHIVDEVPQVPWVVRQYDRGYRVLLTDCLAARAPH